MIQYMVGYFSRMYAAVPPSRGVVMFLFVLCSTGVPLVLEAMAVSGSLENLDLGANGLTGAGLDNLLRGLATCSSLQTLEVVNRKHVLTTIAADMRYVEYCNL